MDINKQNNFIKEHSQSLNFVKLSQSDSVSLIEELLILIGISIVQYSTQEIYNALTKLLPNKSIVETDSLENICEVTGLDQLNELNVYLIWDIYNDIDEFKVSFLYKYWDDIWQPPADDALILYIPQRNKIILITHFDCIYYN